METTRLTVPMDHYARFMREGFTTEPDKRAWAINLVVWRRDGRVDLYATVR